MATLANQQDFLNWLNQKAISSTKQYYENNNYSVKNLLHIESLSLTDYNFEDKRFESTFFENCVFNHCKFFHTIIIECTFKNCKFINCEISWSKFLSFDFIECQIEECTIVGLEMASIKSEKTTFLNCAEILDLQIRGGISRDFTFSNCYLGFIKVESNNNNEQTKLEIFNFHECLLNNGNFDHIDFANSQFKDCQLSLNEFANCTFSSETLNNNNSTPGSEYNFIDIRTILNSQTQSPEVLVALFGIHDQDIKENLIGATSKIIFQSIFISYSFSDKIIARKINDDLLKRGILTFLWERDAPGGKPLNDIMTFGIKEKDRVLFISSKNSLRSKACQFELTSGRKKQEQSWEYVLFPIHIDSYLFDITKDKIRPIELQEEYWQNIEELKRINSIDFKDCFNSDGSVTPNYEKKLFSLIKGLRKEV